MVDYCAETDIEARMMEDFASSGTTPSDTQIGTLISRVSRMIDGIGAVADGTYTATPTNNIEAACVEACVLLIDNLREKDPIKRHSAAKIVETIELWMNRPAETVWAYSTTTSRNQNNDYLGPSRPTRTS